jgi:hypothetical protein
LARASSIGWARYVAGTPKALTCLGCFSSKLPQNRHPERSASQIDRVTQCLCAESKDLGGVYFAHAARSFSTTEPAPGGLATFAQPSLGKQLKGWRRATKLNLIPRSIPTSKTLHRLGDVIGLRWSKAPSSMGKISTAEVLRLRATSAVSRNQSVRRFAQDDDSVRV